MDDWHDPVGVSYAEQPWRQEYTICCCVCGAELYRGTHADGVPLCEECRYGTGEVRDE